MNQSELDRLWSDPSSWKRSRLGITYYCRLDDPRVVVPKPVRWTGWTVNFARPREAWFEMLLSVLIAAGPTLLFVFLAERRLLPLMFVPAAIAGSIVALVLRARRLSAGD